MTDYSKYAKVFKAFCDESRLQILDILRGGERCVCELHDSLPIAQSTLSHHLKILVDSGVVKSRREGKWIYYSFDDAGSSHAQDLLRQLTEHNTAYIMSNCSENTK